MGRSTLAKFWVWLQIEFNAIVLVHPDKLRARAPLIYPIIVHQVIYEI